jgi:glutamine synthetase
MRWGRDNRTCAFRLVGHGPSLRLENRIPGGDVNPYLATAAVVAAGLAGIQEELELEPEFEGNAYGDTGADHVPSSLAEALDLWQGSAFARTTFGDDVVDHYANMAAVELAAFGRSVTDWERIRGFERL